MNKKRDFDTKPPSPASLHPAKDQRVPFEVEETENMEGRPDALPKGQNPLNYPPVVPEEEK